MNKMGINTIGMLTTLHSPLLPIHLKAILKKNFKNVVIICDTFGSKQRDIDNWNYRTGGLLGDYGFNNVTSQLVASAVIPIYHVNDHNSADSISLILREEIDVLVNSGTPRKLHRNLITNVKKGIINIHPGELPKYRGSSAVEWSIFNNDSVANTAHFMDEDYDTGPIIEIQRYRVRPGESYQEIRSGVYLNSGLLLAEVLEKMKKGKVTYETATKQDESIANYWKPIGDFEMQVVLEKIKNFSDAPN